MRNKSGASTSMKKVLTFLNKSLKNLKVMLVQLLLLSLKPSQEVVVQLQSHVQKLGRVQPILRKSQSQTKLVMRN